MDDSKHLKNLNFSLYQQYALLPLLTSLLNSRTKSAFIMDTFSIIGTILVSVLTLICIAQSHILLSKVPQSVPWAGARPEILSKLRACIREITPRSPTPKAGYEKILVPLSTKLELLIALVDGSVEKACLIYFRTLDFVLWLWFLRNM